MTIIVILNAVFAVLIIGALAAVKLTAYHVAGREDEPVARAYVDEERLAA